MLTKHVISTTNQEGMISLVNSKDELIGVIRKDPSSRKNIFYRCDEMSFDELQSLFKQEVNV